MSNTALDLTEFHWMMDILQTIDAGLIVIDNQYQVNLWNGFMENHSGLRADYVRGKNLFDLFSEVPRDWFENKLASVFMLKNRAFTTWEQRPYLFKFKNYRPITGTEEFMYQNVTISPLVSADGTVRHVCLIVYDVTDVAVHKKELETANGELERLSRTDRLTQLFNRGYWEECLAAEYARHQRYKHQSTLVIFDIDHFKKVNDTYGHQAGDEVIRVTSKTLQDSLRNTDIAGRYGGEEFVIILTDTSAKNAYIYCERLRKTIEALTVEHDGAQIQYTVSLGICEISEEVGSHPEWLERADQALYQSKHNGRNKTTLFTPES